LVNDTEHDDLDGVDDSGDKHHYVAGTAALQGRPVSENRHHGGKEDDGARQDGHDRHAGALGAHFAREVDGEVTRFRVDEDDPIESWPRRKGLAAPVHLPQVRQLGLV